MEKIYYTKTTCKKAGMTILISDKEDFRIRNIARDREGDYKIIRTHLKCMCTQ